MLFICLGVKDLMSSWLWVLGGVEGVGKVRKCMGLGIRCLCQILRPRGFVRIIGSFGCLEEIGWKIMLFGFVRDVWWGISMLC